MPRLSAVGKSVEFYCDKYNCGSPHIDLCSECSKKIIDISSIVGHEIISKQYLPCDWEEGAGHPDYEGLYYHCYVCYKLLTEDDD